MESSVLEIREAIKQHESCKRKNCGDDHKAAIKFYKQLLKAEGQ